MGSVFSIGKFSRPRIDAHQLLRFHARMLEIIEPVGGLTGSSMWALQSDPNETLIVNEYENGEIATSSLATLIESPFFVEVVQSFEAPMDAIRIETVEEFALRPHQTEIGEFLSLSQRNSEPGMSDDLIAELKRIFGELHSIDGCAGSFIGRNIVLDEEVVGGVIWRHVESFMDSLPLKVLYEVKLYRRIR